jgi:hypothetical protein
MHYTRNRDAQAQPLARAASPGHYICSVKHAPHTLSCAACRTAESDGSPSWPEGVLPSSSFMGIALPVPVRSWPLATVSGYMSASIMIPSPPRTSLSKNVWMLPRPQSLSLFDRIDRCISVDPINPHFDVERNVLAQLVDGPDRHRGPGPLGHSFALTSPIFEATSVCWSLQSFPPSLSDVRSSSSCSGLGFAVGPGRSLCRLPCFWCLGCSLDVTAARFITWCWSSD